MAKPATRPEYQSFGFELDSFDDPQTRSFRLIYQNFVTAFEANMKFNDLSLYFPVAASVLELSTQKKDSYVVDSFHFLIVPPKIALALKARSSSLQCIQFVLSAELFELMANEYDLTAAEVAAVLKIDDVQKLTRTNWLNELAHRYLFERVVAKKKQNNVTRFLELEIVKEIFYRLKKGHAPETRSQFDKNNFDKHDRVLHRALNYIDTNLTNEVSIKDLVAYCAASESTVLRAFKIRFNMTPSNYLMQRRLDEAMAMLKTKKYLVSEVASQVGFASVSAFGLAFKKRFGLLPSAIAKS